MVIVSFKVKIPEEISNAFCSASEANVAIALQNLSLFSTPKFFLRTSFKI